MTLALLEMNGQLLALATLLLGILPLVYIEWEAEWIPESVWMMLRR
jgi:hypothetical protein